MPAARPASSPTTTSAQSRKTSGSRGPARCGSRENSEALMTMERTIACVLLFGRLRDSARYFQPLRSLFEAGGVTGGGSDPMQKIGSLRSNNPYDPFLGIGTTITRRARWYDGQLHPEEALSREQAVRFYTINNAYILFLDDQCGSLEPGKRADLIVVDTDILACPVDDIRKTRVLKTCLDGKPVFTRS
ncbi:MAG: amidohydrolase family protein [Verrucomicrobia bacterium]|nr:amidohydrolase family protein [Verrucomicrobiota bacterium]